MSVNSIREDERQEEVSKKQTLLRLYRYMLSYRKELAWVALLLAVTVGISLISPLFIERAIDVHVAATGTGRDCCLWGLWPWSFIWRCWQAPGPGPW